MKKYYTYYTVRYACLGADYPCQMVFDNEKDALDFYHSGNYRDNPVAHRVSNKEKVDYYEECMAYQKMGCYE